MSIRHSFIRTGFLLAVAVLATAWVGCGSSKSSPTAPVDPVVTARTQIYQRINALRATMALPPLAQWTASEVCASGQARTDFEASTPHSVFTSCGESGQSEAVGWDSLDLIATDALQAMWDQGPGDFSTHGDYIHLSSTSYHKVAVGIYVTPANKVWAVLNFAPYSIGGRGTCRASAASHAQSSEYSPTSIREASPGVGRRCGARSPFPRRVPLRTALLLELRARSGALVPFAAGSPGSFARTVRRKSGIAGFHPHRCRHTFAMEWLAAGGSLAVLQELLGHRDLTTTMRYARVSSDLVSREAARVEAVRARARG